MQIPEQVNYPVMRWQHLPPFSFSPPKKNSDTFRKLIIGKAPLLQILHAGSAIPLKMRLAREERVLTEQRRWLVPRVCPCPSSSKSPRPVVLHEEESHGE